MKTVVELLERLTEAGIILWLEFEPQTNTPPGVGPRLKYRAPRGAFTPDLRAQVKQHKSALIDLLALRQSATDSPPPPGMANISPRGPFLLSAPQERLWFLDQLYPGHWAYNMFRAFRLTGKLNVRALEGALNALIERHESLRTNFQAIDGVPVQIIAPVRTITITRHDLQDLPPAEQATAVREVLQAATQQPFDLQHDALLRGTLLRLSVEDHVLLLTMHHIITDGWSWEVFLEEFSTYYRGLASGQPTWLPPLPLQYADFARRQRHDLQAGVPQTRLAQLLTYWKEQLADAPPLLELPLMRRRPPVQTFTGQEVRLVLERKLVEQLRAISRQAGSTLYMTLLAAFYALLYRYTGQSELVVGAPIANRRYKELEGLIGFFVNTLPLSVNVANNPTFLELLAQVRQTTLAAYQHQDVPFERLVAELQPERALGYSPIVQLLFVFQNSPQHPLDLPDLTVEPLELDFKWLRMDIEIHLFEQAGTVKGRCIYNDNLYDAATMARMVEHFQMLLAGIAANPQQPIGALPLLTETERQQILIEWNDTATDYASDKCIDELFSEQAARTPDAIAVVFGEESLTYRALNSKANQLAHYLHSLGVAPETLVGICVERSLEMVVGLLGILKAGGAYVPLDPTYPPARLAFMLQDAGVSLLLTQRHLLEQLPATTAELLCLDRDWEKIAHASSETPPSQVTAEQLALVIYTSGSTGRPKGVEGLHRGIMNRCHWMWRQLPFLPGEVACQKTALSFVDSVWEIFGPLLRGVPLIIIADDVVRDPQALIAQLATSHISRLVLVPSLLKVILESDANLQQRLPHLTTWICSGEALSSELAQRFHARMPHARLLNLYGSSEVAGDVAWFDATASRNSQTGATGIPIGRPIDNTPLYLLDAQLQPVPLGVLGELYVGGDNLARGYVKRPKLTDERFIANPYGLGKLFRTGDLARWLPASRGNLEYLGRIDHQVKIRGFRIELGEIESALSQHPAVRESVVVAREERGEKQLVGYIVPAEQTSHIELIPSLRTHLKQRLPDYMVPGAFVTLDALPLTPNGKINRKALPKPTITSAQKSYVPPQTPTQEVLCAIWTEVLGIERVGIHDNFFDIGGHSLLLTQVTSRVASTFGLNLPIQILFQSPTIAQLAERIEDNQLVLALRASTSSENLSSGIATEEFDTEEFVL